MRHADPEQETAARLLGERPLSVRHRHRVARIDVGDTRRHDQRLGYSLSSQEECTSTSRPRLSGSHSAA